MDTLNTLKTSLALYASLGAKCQAYAAFDDVQHTYAVNVIDFAAEDPYERVGVVIFARVVEEQIIIESDLTDKPLYLKLVQAGIPRQQIHLIYAGEPYPPNAQPVGVDGLEPEALPA
jgi:hypothetical protein